MLHSGTPVVPDRLADVTPSWLTAALRRSGHLPSGQVTEVRTAQLGTDRGFTGVVARAQLRYRDPTGTPPASLIVKLPTADQPAPSAYRRRQADLAAVQRHYQRCARELACYQELGIAGKLAPQLYYGAADPDQRRVVLLLADLTEGEPGDQLAAGTATRAGGTLDAIGTLHARWWRHPAPSGAAPFVTDPAASQRRYTGWAEQALASWAPLLPAGAEELIRELRHTYAGVLTELAAAPPTVVHGELHHDNLLFFDAPGAERPVVVLDWQSVRYGPAAVDVAEVIAGSLPPATRQEIETDLLDRFAHRLRLAGVSDYPRARLQQDYRLALWHLLAQAVSWLAHTAPDQAAGRERALVHAALGNRRLISALQDHAVV